MLQQALFLDSIGVKSGLANKGITIERFLPIMLLESFDGDSSVSQSRFDAYAFPGTITFISKSSLIKEIRRVR